MAKLLAASSVGALPNVYLYALAGLAEQNSLATIGSDNTLRLFDPASLDILRAIPDCHAGVSCLLTRTDRRGYATAGQDGLIKLWDPRAQQSPVQLSESTSRGISAIACHDEHYVAAGTESTKEGLGDVSVLVYDTRNPSTALRNYAESHTDSITQLAFHPTQPSLLLSASTDGLVSLLDVNQEDEEDALQQVLNPRSAVHCSGFLAQDHVYVVTTDEHFSIYPLSENAEGSVAPAIDFGDVRPALDCMYVINVSQQNEAGPVVAYGHNEARTLAVVQLQGGPDAWGFGSRVSFPGAHGDEVVRDVLLASSGSRAYTCGEDGRVRVWDTASATHSTASDMPVQSPKHSKKRREKKAERFAPY